MLGRAGAGSPLFEMTTTHHILRHRVATVEMTLDEGTGIFTLHCDPHLPDPTFRRDLQRWAGRIACGWAKRIGYGAGSVVQLNFSSRLGRGRYIGSFQAHLAEKKTNRRNKHNGK